MSTDATVPAPTDANNAEEPVTKMDTSTDVPVPPTEDKVENNTEEVTAAPEMETKGGKRKRSTKKSTETDEVPIANSRPRRTLPKREESSAASASHSSTKSKSQRQSVEEDADDEQERDKTIPVVHDVADVVWVKMGGHPWWPSLVIRDPNDPTRSFTKTSGNARAKRLYFVVFYGSTADFAWVSDAAIIPYKGVEAFTCYAQEIVDKAQTKSQKEQLTERFQLKVTIGRREDWEMAVREADAAMVQSSETRLEEIEPKLEFYTSKFVSSKQQSGRRRKGSDAGDASALSEKGFDFNSEDDISSDESPVRKPSSMKIKLKKQASNDDESNTVTPPAKRRYVRKSGASQETKTAQQASSNSQENESTNAKKRGRPRLSKPSVIANNEENSSGKKSIVKPQAFTNKSVAMNNVMSGQHYRFDVRTGFLSPFEEQEVFTAIDQLRSSKTLEEVEQVARRRFEQILCFNLNRTQVDIPEEWFYSFLFAHPILIMKNPQWFPDKMLQKEDETKNAPSANDVSTLKRQLTVLSKLYRNELETCSANIDENLNTK